jgi:uncharacterized Rmd1/YagE family protein
MYAHLFTYLNHASGSIELSRTEMAMKVGKLFIERNNINLHFDILDTPEFFWEQDVYKSVYDSLFNYLELGMLLFHDVMMCCVFLPETMIV